MLTIVAADGMWGAVLPTAGRRILSVPSCLRKGGKTWQFFMQQELTATACPLLLSAVV